MNEFLLSTHQNLSSINDPEAKIIIYAQKTRDFWPCGNQCDISKKKKKTFPTTLQSEMIYLLLQILTCVQLQLI